MVDTRPSLGPFRERGSRGNTKRRNFVRGYANRWEDTYRSMLHAWQVKKNLGGHQARACKRADRVCRQTLLYTWVGQSRVRGLVGV